MRHQSLLLSRLALRRRPILYWLVTALVAITTATVIGGLTARAEHASARYGGLRPVVVANRALGAGDEVVAGSVRLVRVPRAFVPDGALSSPPVGQTVLSPLYPGEALLAQRLAPEGLRGIAALLPPGTLAMAVPTGTGGLRVAVGDLVDVLATAGFATAPTPTAPTPAAGTPVEGGGQTGGVQPPDGDGSTRVVASDAKVVDVSDQTVTVAVRDAEAPLVATALTQATITLALSTSG